VDENESLGQLAVDQTPQQWLVNTVYDGRRLDVFLSAHLPKFTRREVIEEIAAGRARINGHVSLTTKSLIFSSSSSGHSQIVKATVFDWNAKEACDER